MLERIQSGLIAVESRLGFDPLVVEQGTYQWHQMRLGVVTASNVSKIFKPTRGAGLTRIGYMNELIGEICTGLPQDEISAKALEWGKENEPKARELYLALGHGQQALEAPFAYRDDSMRFGCSPDGIDGESGIEIKCPFTTKVHIDTLLNGTIKKEYHDQMQYSMWVTGAKEWKFVSFDPRMTRENLVVIPVQRNEKRIAEIEAAAFEFAFDMDKALHQLGFDFGEQWK